MGLIVPEKESDLAPYPEISAEFPGVELEWNKNKTTMEEPEGPDEYKEVMAAEENCDLMEWMPQNLMERHDRELDNVQEEMEHNADDLLPETKNEDNDEEVKIINRPE